MVSLMRKSIGHVGLLCKAWSEMQHLQGLDVSCTLETWLTLQALLKMKTDSLALIGQA